MHAVALLMSLSPLVVSATYQKVEPIVQATGGSSPSSEFELSRDRNSLPSKNVSTSSQRVKPSESVIDAAMNNEGLTSAASSSQADTSSEPAELKCLELEQERDRCFKAVAIAEHGGFGVMACSLVIPEKALRVEGQRPVQGGCVDTKGTFMQIRLEGDNRRRRRLRQRQVFQGVEFKDDEELVSFIEGQDFILQIKVHDECTCYIDYDSNSFAALCPNTQVCRDQVAEAL
ncbi:hypothetical protein ACA910_004382 [Epithemia clementina (nom. ined.)]